MRITPEVRFGALFVVGFVTLAWIFRDPSPLPGAAALQRGLVVGQTRLAAGVLELVGQQIGAAGNLLSGPRFTCEVGSGCSGLQALMMAWAAVLAFPASLRARLLGVALLTPAIVAVNLLRIIGLWLAGAYRPELFDLGHVYLGQVAVILSTAGLWWSWASRQSPGGRPVGAAPA